MDIKLTASVSLATRFLTIGYIIYFCVPSVEGQFETDLTLQNVWERLSLSNDKCMIQCISSDELPNKIKFTRPIDTGQGTRLPKYSQQYILGKPLFARILSMRKEDMLSRFGVYQCRVTKNGVSTEVVTLKLPPLSLAELDIIPHYRVVNVGTDVELKVDVLKKQDLPIRWRHNGKKLPASWDDQLTVTIQNVKVSDSGVYESFYEGRRGESLHALTRLVVRGCPNGFYGGACDQECPSCYNGGVCHAEYGVCVCPPGFAGAHCQKACGGNRFGSDCTKLCSPPKNNTDMDDGCALYLFCKPDPYSCSCASGFKGATCVEHCEPGWYGADCKQPCHCAFGVSSCHRITGACDGGCAKGWRGESCEIYDPTASAGIETTTSVSCPIGSYGARCEKKCHCAGNEPCDIISGHCPSGCEDGWSKAAACSVCSPGGFGANCEFHCHCSGGNPSCDKDGFCLMGCEAGWAGFTCQQECTSGRFGQNCASTCHCLAGSSTCDRMNGNCNGDCEPGFMGKDCQILCPRNSYGINCNETCSCFNNGNCNRIDGTCTCEGRWRGRHCNESEPQILAATDEEVNTGQFVVISCTADAVPEPEMNISSTEFFGLSFGVRSLEKDQYQALMKVTPEKADKYEFSCSAKNLHGFDLKIVTLTVIDPPKLQDPPEILNSTSDSLTIKWKPWNFSRDEGGKEGDNIEYIVVYRDSTSRGSWTNYGSWLNTNDTTIAIHDLTPYTEYEVAIRCRRPGVGGEGEPSPATISRTECGDPPADAIPESFVPDILSVDSVRLMWRGPSDSSLHCKLIGYDLIYYGDGNPEDKMNISLAATTEFEVYSLAYETLYTFRLYPITAMGTSKFFAEFNFRTASPVPGAVRDLSYQANEESVTLSWKDPVLSYGTINEYVITYKLTNKGQCGEDFEDHHLKDAQSTSTDHNEITLILLPYSTYFITVAAKTAAGEGESTSLSVVTLEAAPDSGPTNLRVGEITQTSIDIFWDPIPCQFANGLITEYEYSLLASEFLESDDLPGFKRKVKRKSDVDVGSSFFKKVKGLNATMKGLKPDTEYVFGVRGYTKVDSGPFSDFMSARTKEGIPSAPSELQIAQTEPNQITLSWLKPRPSNGELVSYKIRYRERNSSQDSQKELISIAIKEDGVLLPNSRVSVTIAELDGATDYLFKVQAATAEGWGEWSHEITGRTGEDVPGKPENLTVTKAEETEIGISWRPPTVTNGVITNYRVKYVVESYKNTNQTVINLNGSDTNVILQNLREDTGYYVRIQAKTTLGFGPSAAIHCRTVRANEIPPILHVSLKSENTNDTIKISFSAKKSSPDMKYQVIVEDSLNMDPIDEHSLKDYDNAVVKDGLPYYIAAEIDPSNMSSDGEREFVVGDRKVWGGYRNVHLNPGHKYRIRIRAITKKNNTERTLMSEPYEQITDDSIFNVNYQQKERILGFELLPFILLMLSVFVVTFLIFFFTVLAVCRKREKRKTGTAAFSNRNSGLSESLTWSVMYKVSETESIDGPLVSEGWKYSSNIDKSTLKKSKAYEKSCQGIPIENLAEYVHNAIANNKLSDEFKQLVSGQTAPWSIARKSENLKKNRYGNILPYDRYCVVIQPEAGASESEYINASYVDGYNRPHEYIVTQGPLEITVTDFWRMVWQENSPAVVMLTDLVENGKKKCFKYWPDDSMMCGKIQVLLIHVEENADFVIRTILMQKKDESRTHRVIQYQFTGWPDRTVPSTSHFLLRMIRKVRDDHPVLGGPIVVHCSAGAGRSGTYIALDSLIQQANEESRVDIFRIVNKSRLQRINLVQTEEQYLFIHEALLEALLYEETSVPLEKIALYLQQMRELSPHYGKSFIGKQFQVLKDTQKLEEVSTCCSVALSEYNVFKNRDVMTVPTDSTRILLQCELDVDNSDDYINAVLVPGYRKRDAYIATQMPMKHTINDFLRLVNQSQSSLILMLNELEEEDSDDNGQYWPTDGERTFGNFKIEIVSIEDHDDYTVRTMKISKRGEVSRKPRQLIQIQYKKWEQFIGNLDDAKPMLNLIKTVDLWYQRTDGGPIIVHCMDGATRCGLYCISAYVCAQVKAEQMLDAYQAVKYIRINRQEFIPDLDQYAFCFKLANELQNTRCTDRDSTASNSFGTLKRLPYKI